MDNLKAIEALMYIQGEKGLTPSDVKSAIDVPTLNARKLLQEYKRRFNEEDRGIEVVEFNDVFKFITKEEYNEPISRLVTIIKKQKLSSSAIETAAIIAYKQPITKSAITDIRGKSSEATVATLLTKGIIVEKGVAQTPGNPILYGITDKFYDYFNIKSLSELPKFDEFDEDEAVDNDFELFSSQRQD